MAHQDTDRALAALLHRDNRIEFSVLQTLLDQASATGAGLGAALTHRGLLTPVELAQYMAFLSSDSRPEAEGSPQPSPRPGGLLAGIVATRMPEQIGGCRLIELLGAGGMGAVYLCEHPTGVRYAVKLLASRATGNRRTRFVREGHVQAKTDAHPNVVKVHSAGEESDYLYLIMDVCEGGDLHKRLQQNGPLDPGEAVRIGAALADGLHYVHDHGILHRDMKPANVLFDEQGTPKLVDFGLAADIDAKTLTKEGAMMGTPAYMAPEQAAGRTKQIDARTDVYGLGVLLFEALTGELPFAGGAIATIRGIMEDDPPSLRSLRRGIPAGLERVILKALAKDRADRFQTAAEMAAALRAGTAGRVRKRRRYGVGLAVALAVALLAAAAGMTIRETSTALSVDEVNHQAALLRTEARELLYAARPVADDRARIESWSERSKRLRGVSKRGSNARSAVEQGEADIAALQGLLALESGERVAALRRQKDVERVRDTDGIAALAIAGSVSAITTRDDPLKAAETLDAAIAAGVARPELLGWRAHANLRHALAKFRQGDYSGAIAVVGSANHQAIRARTRHAVLTEARREISLGARALSRLGRDEKAPRDDMARLRAQLFFLHAVCPAEPVSPEGLKELMTLATHPRRTLSLEFEFQLADMYQDDFEVQRAMAKRIIFAGGDTARHRAASRRFAPIAKRAATLAPNREEELRHLELHGDMLVDGLQYVAGMKLANELLTQTDLSQRLRAKCHFWRSNRLSTLHKSKEAIVEADKALALDGTLLRCHFRRSKALQRLKQWDGALRASLVYVRETDPHIAQNSFSWYHRSVTRAFECSRKISKPYAYDLSAEAIVAMLDVRNQAYFAGWWVRLGFVQLRAGRVDAAISSLETAVSRLPGNPPHFAIMKCKLLEKCKPLLKAVREKGVDATGAYRKVINHLETVRAGEVLP